MTKASLPPGFRFHPTDIELIMYYLKRKVMGRKLHIEAIADVNIYKFSPWDLPDKSCLKSRDLEWFFFCPREKKYSSGVRVKRATENGYWKITGKDRSISYNNVTVGVVKTLVFHLGHAPKGERTDWVIHEYRILDKELATTGLQDTYVLCKVFQKSGLGPKNGAQYGAPFNEAEWSCDDIDDTKNNATSSTSWSPTSLMRHKNQNSMKTSLCDHGTTAGELPLIEQGPSCLAGHSFSEVMVDENDDEIVQMLSEFTDDNRMHFDGKEIKQDALSGKGKNLLPCSDGFDMYDGLGDLDACPHLNESQHYLSTAYNNDYSLNTLFEEDFSYIELADLMGPINSSAEFTGPVQLSADEIMGSYKNWEFQQCYSGIDFVGLDQFTSCTNQLPAVSNGYYREDNSLDVMRASEPYRNAVDLPCLASRLMLCVIWIGHRINQRMGEILLKTRKEVDLPIDNCGCRIIHMLISSNLV